MEIKWKFIEMIIRLLVLSLFCCGMTVCAPTTRPLEHSPSELAWDAWLQQGSKQALPPRRITTKSLFVFPNLGPEALPACADGYRADSLGRCVKIVKVDQNANLDFLLQKLNSQFGTENSENQDEVYDYDIDVDTPDTSGPFQFSIPLALPSTGSKSEDSIPGDFVVISKKDQQQLNKTTTEKLPTSSPEVVPEYNNENQFFLDGISATSKKPLLQNGSDSAEPVSILFQNSTNTGITLLIHTNGKFDNVTDSNENKGVINMKKELENIKTNITDIHESSVTEPPHVKLVESEYINQASKKHIEENEEISAEIQNKVIETSDKNKEAILPVDHKDIANSSALNIAKNDSLVKEIEALKSNKSISVIEDSITEEQKLIPISKVAHLASQTGKNITTANEPKGIKSESSEENPTKHFNTKDIDIEEKIKIISRLADVSRNTEGPHPSNNDFLAQKKTSSELVKSPVSNSMEYPGHTRGHNQADMGSSSGSFIRFPSSSERLYPPHNSVFGVVPPPENHAKFQPHSNYERIPELTKEPPQWLPSNWNIDSNPSGEHNLMDFWSRMPSVQRYPFNVQLQHDRHPSYYHTLYPGSLESGSRINVRQAPMNYRQGRDDTLRRQQFYQEDSMNYKRSRHPHFRESEELSRILEAYNGR